MGPGGRGGGEELGGAEGGKIVIRICYMRKKKLFNKEERTLSSLPMRIGIMSVILCVIFC